METNINNLVNTMLFESWAKFSRTLYIHKLKKPSSDLTIDSLEMLQKIGIIKDINEVYIYSFIHTDSNQVVSFTGGQNLRKNIRCKVWLTFVNPLRGMLYKGGGQQGGMDTFSSERIMTDFDSTAFLFTGEINSFKKIAEIPTKAISTTVPIPFMGINFVYENIKMDCRDNKYNLETVQFKRVKGFTLPQVVLKSNYFYVFNCETT